MSVATCLREVPQLAELSHTSLDLLAFAFVETDHGEGELVADRRAIPRVHVVLEGEVEVSTEVETRRLGPGTLFGIGEHAQYRALGRCRTAELSPYAFARLTSAPGEITDTFRRAIRAALGHESAPPSATETLPGAPTASAAAVGSVVATLAAGLACVGPIIAAALGLGGLGLLADASALRVPATLLTIVLLVSGFRRAYGRSCAPASPATRTARGLLWVATTFAIAMALLQYVTLPYLT